MSLPCLQTKHALCRVHGQKLNATGSILCTTRGLRANRKHSQTCVWTAASFCKARTVAAHAAPEKTATAAWTVVSPAMEVSKSKQRATQQRLVMTVSAWCLFELRYVFTKLHEPLSLMLVILSRCANEKCATSPLLDQAGYQKITLSFQLR